MSSTCWTVNYNDITPVLNGANAAVGLQRPGAQQYVRTSYSFNQPGTFYTGLSLAFALNPGSNPLEKDSDHDGLTDYEEVNGIPATDPRQPDTDGDGLTDGWERDNNMNPAVNNDTDGIPNNGANEDFDGDGLTNAQENDLGTSGTSGDSDGDLVGDAAEFANGSDPNNSESSSSGDLVRAEFYFGDHSGSHSEKYCLRLSPMNGIDPRGPINMVNLNYGQCETKENLLYRGEEYTLTLEHAGTSRSGSPDYDYTLEVTVPQPNVIDDPDAIICVNNDSTSFYAQGKQACIRIGGLDLDIDLDYDGTVNNDKSEEQTEADPGAFTAVSNRVAIALRTMDSVTWTGTAELVVPTGIEVYAAPTGGTPLSSFTFNSSSLPQTLYVMSSEPGVYTLRLVPAGLNSGDAVELTVVKVEFVYAQGENEGEPIEGDLGLFTPSSGVNAGIPIYDTPDVDLAFEIGGLYSNTLDSVNLTYFDARVTLTETGNDTLVFTNAGFALTFIAPLLADSNVLESVRVSVTASSYGITNAQYECWETTSSSLSFVNETTAIITSLSGLSSNVVDIMLLQLSDMEGEFSFNLMETSTDSCCFQSTEISATLVNISTLTVNADTLHISLNNFGLYSNTVFSVNETGGEVKVFRNFDEPLSTTIPDIAVPDFLPWKVKIHGIIDPERVSPLLISTTVYECRSTTFSAISNSLISDQKFIIVPDDITSQDVPSGYEVININAVELDWTDATSEDLTLAFEQYAMLNVAGCSKNKKVQPDAVVLQSLPWQHRVGLGLDPENRIRKPYIEMGYSAIRDYHASVSDTLNKYIKGKQLWYSMSHGALTDGTPYSVFQGLKFKDGGITKNQLDNLNLNYRLVVADGCCSAHASLDSVEAARTSSTLTKAAQAFADSFGPDVAYMGWGWTMTPNAAQLWSSEFINNLKYMSGIKRGRTVDEAHAEFMGDHTQAADAKLMKVYGNIDAVIEKRGGDE
ncbi:MAG: hypothetical protein PHO37_02885 [Kiritimatiellae bacterium]|nr:hypothetical protein [Kiritimatiellia bacterium]